MKSYINACHTYSLAHLTPSPPSPPSPSLDMYLLLTPSPFLSRLLPSPKGTLLLEGRNKEGKEKATRRMRSRDPL
ncbi:hypothetical protein E2C01_071776 [Portunus trituberculatus]|uniref:Uncharacterized protein n=1 Tax=Portunus trituberculatus TaxID=210409 RepID=A0A5B7I9B8_PORTR|nr:hypothetical protein [Portunus trituberculatus]